MRVNPAAMILLTKMTDLRLSHSAEDWHRLVQDTLETFTEPELQAVSDAVDYLYEKVNEDA